MSLLGLDLKGQLSQEDMQQLLDEKMVQQVVSPEMMEIARTGKQAMARIQPYAPPFPVISI